MSKRSLCILLAAVLGGLGPASARADQRNPQAGANPAQPPDDVQVTVMSGKGRLGVAALQISPELRTQLGAPGDRGVLLDAVRPDSPAARAGLRVGDIVTDVDGAPARSAHDVITALADRKTGDEVAISAIRKGQRVLLRARLDSDPGPAWQSQNVRGFRRFPDEMNRWFPFDDNAGDLRRAIEDLEKRMDALEHRPGKPAIPGATERI